VHGHHRVHLRRRRGFQNNRSDGHEPRLSLAGDPNGAPQILVLHLREGRLRSSPSGRWGRRRTVAGAAEVYTFSDGNNLVAVL